MKSAKLLSRLMLFGAVLTFTNHSFTALNDNVDATEVFTEKKQPDTRSAEIFMRTDNGSDSAASIDGTNGRVVWMYAGFLPRVYDYKRARVVVSYKGLTARVSLKLTKEDVENYSNYIVDRFQEFEDIRHGHVNFPWVYRPSTKNKSNPQERFENRRTPFNIVKFHDDPELDENLQFYLRQLHFVSAAVVPVAENRISGKSRFRANLDLLKSLFPYKFAVIEDDGVETGRAGAFVHFHQVFPITGAAEGPTDRNAPKTRAGYGMYKSDGSKAKRLGFEELEEYKTKYKDKNNIFAGMPFIQINSFEAGAGLHAPIRFMEQDTLVNGQSAHYGLTHGEQENSGRVRTERNWEELKKQTQVRWSLIREFASGGCGRMEHVVALRNMLPADAMKRTDGTIEASLLPAVENGYRTAQPSLQQIGISMQKDYDYFDFNNDGIVELVGVNYYRFGRKNHKQGTHSQENWDKMRNDWINKFYMNPKYAEASKPQINGIECEYDTGLLNPSSSCQLAEFPYSDPGLVQVSPKKSLTPDGLSEITSRGFENFYLRQALAAQLNRAPQERANKDQPRIIDNKLELWED